MSQKAKKTKQKKSYGVEPVLVNGYIDQNATKNKLMQLDKTKLMKQCISFGIKYRGLNQKVKVDKILNKMLKAEKRQKIDEKDNKKQLILLSALNNGQIVDYYVKQRVLQLNPNNNNSKPYEYKPINALIKQYVGKMIAFFDCCPLEYKDAIQNHGLLIHRKSTPKYRSLGKYKGFSPYWAPIMFACSDGYNLGINIFKLKLYPTDWSSYSDYSDSIGIITNIKQCENKNLSIIPSHAIWTRTVGHQYFLSMSGLQIKAYNNIKCVVNCNQWKVKFYVNKKLIQTYDIESNQTYYPAIYTVNPSKYRVCY